jgi:pimeloyl-ACP methyl ester carboxylesterase
MLGLVPLLPVPGGQLYYEVTGQGPALIFAHGLGGNHLSWWQQVPHFRDRFACVTFAHRGFFPSSSSGQPDPATFLGDLESLIDHLGFGQVRLVAQSMGGWTCLGFALRAPARVRALVLASTQGTLRDVEVARWRDVERPAQEAVLLAGGIHPAAGERMAREQPALHFLYREIAALSPTLDRGLLRRRLAELCTTPPQALAALTMPVLAITGEEDAVLPPAAVERMAGLIPQARLERVPQAGHSVYFERARRFNASMDSFLEVSGAGATARQ